VGTRVFERLLRELEGRIVERLDALRREIRGPERPPIHLDEPLVKAFLRWSKARVGKKWHADQRRYLGWWADQLAGVNLRAADLAQDILAPLDKLDGGRTPRIAVLKRFYSWLRTERHLLKPQEDPTLDALKVPQSDPEQWVSPKVVPDADFRAALARWAKGG